MLYYAVLSCIRLACTMVNYIIQYCSYIIQCLYCTISFYTMIISTILYNIALKNIFTTRYHISLYFSTYYTRCTIYCILCTIYAILYTLYRRLYTAYYVQYTIHYVLCTVYHILPTTYSLLSTLYYMLYSLYSVLHTLHCTLYIIY